MNKNFTKEEYKEFLRAFEEDNEQKIREYVQLNDAKIETMVLSTFDKGITYNEKTKSIGMSLPYLGGGIALGCAITLLDISPQEWVIAASITCTTYFIIYFYLNSKCKKWNSLIDKMVKFLK